MIAAVATTAGLTEYEIAMLRLAVVDTFGPDAPDECHRVASDMFRDEIAFQRTRASIRGDRPTSDYRRVALHQTIETIRAL